jgi:hypothetical protein
MSDDYSRFSFDPRYSGVLPQHGRTLLDQDWNGQSAMASRGFRAAMVDVLGRVFVATPSAFKIENDSRGGLTIGRGRIYVDGLVAENHGAGRLVWDPALDEQHGAEPVSYTQQPYLAVPDCPPADPIRFIWTCGARGDDGQSDLANSAFEARTRRAPADGVAGQAHSAAANPLDGTANSGRRLRD